MQISYEGPIPRIFSLPDGTTVELQPGDVIPTGATMRSLHVPLLMKDHQPHWVTPVQDNDEDEMYAAYERRKIMIANAWRNPEAFAPANAVHSVEQEKAPVAATVEEAHAAMIARMRNAWKE